MQFSLEGEIRNLNNSIQVEPHVCLKAFASKIQEDKTKPKNFSWSRSAHENFDWFRHRQTFTPFKKWKEMTQSLRKDWFLFFVFVFGIHLDASRASSIWLKFVFIFCFWLQCHKAKKKIEAENEFHDINVIIRHGRTSCRQREREF